MTGASRSSFLFRTARAFTPSWCGSRCKARGTRSRPATFRCASTVPATVPPSALFRSASGVRPTLTPLPHDPQGLTARDRLSRREHELHVGLHVEVCFEQRIIIEVFGGQLHALDVVGRKRAEGGELLKRVDQRR